jgi:transcriptional regulator with XRE-family HTH domain
MAIHKTLRDARERTGMSQEDAAKHLGISGASFSRMESGESAVTTDRLFKLAALYKVSAASLLEGAIVTHPSAIDLERLKLAIIEVEKVVSALGVRPSPQKVADAVAELYRTEIEHIIEHPRESFTPARHARLLELIFRN